MRRRASATSGREGRLRGQPETSGSTRSRTTASYGSSASRSTQPGPRAPRRASVQAASSRPAIRAAIRVGGDERRAAEDEHVEQRRRRRDAVERCRHARERRAAAIGQRSPDPSRAASPSTSTERGLRPTRRIGARSNAEPTCGSRRWRRRASTSRLSTIAHGENETVRVPRRPEAAQRAACAGAAARYQATVRSSPSRSGVRARKPNSSSARDASSCRRGWPFGIDVSQTISPSKPVTSAIDLGELADRRLDAGAEVDRLGAVVALRREQRALRRSRRRRGTRASACRRPRARPRPATRSSSGSAPGSRASVSRSKLSRGP